MIHVLHFSKQDEADLAGAYIYEKIANNVVIGIKRVAFRTKGWVDGRTQIAILTHVNCYNTNFNIREVGMYGYMVRN